MMRHLMLGLLALALTTGTASAQQGGDPEALRERIEARFSERVQRELQLTDEEAAKLRATTREFAGRRRGLLREERELRGALAGQMQPGVAANQDSVAKLTDRLTRVRGSLADLEQQEVEALGFLQPTQRARYLGLRERLMSRVREAQQMRERRMERRRFR